MLKVGSYGVLKDIKIKYRAVGTEGRGWGCWWGHVLHHFVLVSPKYSRQNSYCNILNIYMPGYLLLKTKGKKKKKKKKGVINHPKCVNAGDCTLEK